MLLVEAHVRAVAQIRLTQQGCANATADSAWELFCREA